MPHDSCQGTLDLSFDRQCHHLCSPSQYRLLRLGAEAVRYTAAVLAR